MRRLIPAGAVLVLLAALAWWLLARGEPHAPEAAAAAADDAGAALPQRISPSAKLQLMRARTATRGDGGAEEAPPPPGVVAQFGWGNGAGKLGRHRPEEANPEGPMSVTRDAQGNTWVLDQVNNRLVKLDKNGKPAGEVPLPLQSPQDVAFTKDGTAAVLDRNVDGAVALIGPDGKQLGELKVIGKGVAQAGALTGVFTDGDDVYVEREHGDLVKLGDSKGKPDPDRPEVPGRPTRDGLSYLSASMSEPTTGGVAVTSIDRATKQHRFTRVVPLGGPILALMLLDTDRSGVIYVGGALEVPPPGAPVISILCLDPLDGRPIGRAQLPANVDADETFRELAVLDEGGVMFLHRTEDDAQLMRADCR